MKPTLFEYVAPATLDEAVAARASYDDSVVLAGGQSLVPTLNFRLSNPEVVVDLRNVPGLSATRVHNGWIEVGAMSRQRDVELNHDIFEANPLIRETLENVAHPVIRNRGTIAGSIAHADPSAELPCLLTALEGTVAVHGERGQREIPAAELFEFIMTTSLEPTEIITAVRFPALEPGAGWCFVEFARRHGDFALAGVACVLSLHPDGAVADARLAACGVSTTPVRLTTVEKHLVAQPASAENFAHAAALAAEAVDASDDGTVSRAYRTDLLVGLVERALHRSLSRATHKEEAR